MDAVSRDQFMRPGGYGRRDEASRRGRKVERIKGANQSARRQFRSLSLDERVPLSENNQPGRSVLTSTCDVMWSSLLCNKQVGGFRRWKIYVASMPLVMIVKRRATFTACALPSNRTDLPRRTVP